MSFRRINGQPWATLKLKRFVHFVVTCVVFCPQNVLFVVGFVRYALLCSYLNCIPKHPFILLCFKICFNCPTDELGLAISNEELVKVLAEFFLLSASLQHGV